MSSSFVEPKFKYRKHISRNITTQLHIHSRTHLYFYALFFLYYLNLFLVLFVERESERGAHTLTHALKTPPTTTTALACFLTKPESSSRNNQERSRLVLTQNKIRFSMMYVCEIHGLLCTFRICVFRAVLQNT